jgi:hypothetical protein
MADTTQRTPLPEAIETIRIIRELHADLMAIRAAIAAAEQQKKAA